MDCYGEFPNIRYLYESFTNFENLVCKILKNNRMVLKKQEFGWIKLAWCMLLFVADFSVANQMQAPVKSSPECMKKADGSIIEDCGWNGVERIVF